MTTGWRNAAGVLGSAADVGIERRATGFVAVMAATRISSPVNRHRPAGLKGGDRAGSKEKPSAGLG
jgi:hypothetical protein